MIERFFQSPKFIASGTQKLFEEFKKDMDQKVLNFVSEIDSKGNFKPFHMFAIEYSDSFINFKPWLTLSEATFVQA